MVKMRVYLLGKELGVPSKEILDILEGLGTPAASHMSGIDDETVELIREYLAEKAGDSRAKKTKAAPVATTPSAAEEAPAAVEPKKPQPAPVAVEPVTVEPIEKPKKDDEKEKPRKIVISRSLAVPDLAEKLGVESGQVIDALAREGIESDESKVLGLEVTRRIASHLGVDIDAVDKSDDALFNIERESEKNRRDVGPRAPVVTIMGHVDHGKTTILDEMRKSKIVDGEAGSITQHIGAYYVETPQGDVVFLDTPGHQAFTAMRARGAHVTDIVVLVVAVDDGLMPQTEEAIRHAKTANVPIIVALNKIDKAKENVERVKRSFARFGLLPEKEGGETIFIETSAIRRVGLESLLEMIIILSQMLDLKAPRKGPARGTIIETKLDKGRGPVATVLVQEGLLERGDTFVAGMSSGKVRAMTDDLGRKVKEAGPSRPIEVMGFDSMPHAGDVFYAIPKGRKAKDYLQSLEALQREEELKRAPKMPGEPYLPPLEDEVEARAQFSIILKVDVFGSLGALSNSLSKTAKGEVDLEIIHSGVGSVSKADVSLAEIASAEIIGFGIKVEPQIAAFAKQQGVKISRFDVIYSLLDYVATALVKLEKPTLEEEEIGRAEIRAIFSIPSAGRVAGCFVQSGRIARDGKARVFRNGEEIYSGKISSLKRFKKDVKEVQTNFDCGIGLHGFQGYQEKDIIQCYKLVEKRPE
ncbi:translation initiation factor IF-2 [bacterium]|nr:translation initiation factor IF-2 [bacterium]